jgi:hypothetical protein
MPPKKARTPGSVAIPAVEVITQTDAQIGLFHLYLHILALKNMALLFNITIVFCQTFISYILYGS